MTYSCRRTIRLTECVENKVQLVLRDTDTCVHDTELEGYALVIESQQTRAQRDVSLASHLGRGEFDCVRPSWK